MVFSVRTGERRDHRGPIGADRGRGQDHGGLGKDGTMTLTVGEPAGRHREGPGVDPAAAGGDFCVGHDNGQPVANYSKGKPFQGKITDLKVTTP